MLWSDLSFLKESDSFIHSANIYRAMHHMLYMPCTTIGTRATAETFTGTVQLKGMLTTFWEVAEER